MAAIALERLKVEPRDGQNYPVLVLRDEGLDVELELYVEGDPRAAWFGLCGLIGAAIAHQSRMPVTKTFRPYSPGNPPT